MSFTAGMPESGSSLGNTRQKFVDNFATIRTAIQANHENINNAGAGKHQFCQFMSVAAGTTSATELAFYNKVTGAGQRFFMRQVSSGTQIQMSGIDPFTNADTGYTFLPGGLVLAFGKTTVSVSDGATITFPNALTFDSIITVVAGRFDTDAGLQIVSVKSATTTGFVVKIVRADNGATSSCKISYYAIGTKA